MSQSFLPRSGRGAVEVYSVIGATGPPFPQEAGFLLCGEHAEGGKAMNFEFSHVKTMKFWHVPSCVATLTMGIYLMLAYFIPAFAPVLHGILFSNNFHRVVPYAIATLVGSPLFALWFYTRVETDADFREWYFN